MICATDEVHYESIAVFVCLYITPSYYDHYADPSESIELLKCMFGTFCLECMSKIKSIILIIFHAIYGVLRMQLTHLSYDDCENMCTLSYHHQIRSITHLLLFRVRPWNNSLRYMYYLYFYHIYILCSLVKCYWWKELFDYSGELFSGWIYFSKMIFSVENEWCCSFHLSNFIFKQTIYIHKSWSGSGTSNGFNIVKEYTADNTPQPIDQKMNSSVLGTQVGNCNSFALAHY